MDAGSGADETVGAGADAAGSRSPEHPLSTTRATASIATAPAVVLVIVRPG